MVEHEEIFDLLPAYALGCLEAQEKAAVDRHLATCQACRAELLAYQAVTDRFGFAALPVTPPAALRDKVMDRILSKRRPAQPYREKGSFLNFFVSRSLAWNLVGLVIILGLVGSNLLLWRQVSQLQATNRLLQQASRNHFQTIAMVGTSAAPQASGVLIISPDGEHGTLVVEEMLELEPDRQYQLWLIEASGKRISGGVFSVSEDGYGSLWVHAPKPLSSYPEFGITIEPAGGSPGPTGEKVLGSEG